MHFDMEVSFVVVRLCAAAAGFMCDAHCLFYGHNKTRSNVIPVFVLCIYIFVCTTRNAMVRKHAITSKSHNNKRNDSTHETLAEVSFRLFRILCVFFFMCSFFRSIVLGSFHVCAGLFGME